MKKYKYLLFDLDGTLTLSHPGIYACFRYALAAFGKENPSDEELKKCVGPSLGYAFKNFFGLEGEDVAKAVAKYRERYAVVGLFENDVMPYAIECLKALKEAGYSLAMATSKPKVFSDQIADRFGFTEYLTVLVGSGIDGSLPTKADVIKEVMRQFGAAKEECLMIGDRFHDREGAKLCGIDCAMLRVGYAVDGEIESCAPEYVFDGLQELTEFLLAE